MEVKCFRESFAFLTRLICVSMVRAALRAAEPKRGLT